MSPLLRRLLDLTSFNSHTFNAEGVTHAAELACGYLRELGFAPALLPTPPLETLTRDGPRSTPLGPTVLATRPASPGLEHLPAILLNIHLDTVHPPSSPFATSIVGDRAVGPGVADAKGGLVVLLEALRLRLAAGLACPALEVLLNPDEEIGSPGSIGHLRQAARRCRTALVFEPSHPDGALVAARKGSGNYTLVVRGRAAHAGRNPADGRNAVVAAARLVAAISELQVPDASLNVGVIEGGGAANVVPDLCIARINARSASPEAIPELESRLRGLIAPESLPEGITAELTGSFASPPRPANRRLLELADRTARASGQPLPPPRDSGGACDGNKLHAAGCDVLDSLGPVGGELHTDREYILLPSLETRAGLAARLIGELAGG